MTNEKKKPHPLHAIGCMNVEDSLFVLPKSFMDGRKAFEDLYNAPKYTRALFRAKARSWRAVTRSGETTRSMHPAAIEFEMLFKNSSVMRLRFFGLSPDEAKVMHGQEVFFEAHVTPSGQRVFLNSPKVVAPTGKIEPVYAGVSGKVSKEAIRRVVQNAAKDADVVALAARRLDGMGALQSLMRKHGIESSQSFLEDLHQPTCMERAQRALAIARQSVVDEIREAALFGKGSADCLPATYNIDEALIAAVKAQPETLSDDQRRALNVIRKNINHRAASRTLLNGDVGCGKTLVFLLALAAVARASGKDVGVMVPSTIVATQIYTTASERFPDLHPLLINSEGGEEARHFGISPRMLIGTQAMLNKARSVEFAALVVDEQQKMSVAQRAALVGEHTHVIEASATPVPRSLAVAIFGGWQEARIARAPVKKEIVSMRVPESERSIVSGWLRYYLCKGKRIIILYPRVRGEGSTVLAAAERLNAWAPGKIAVLHGGQSMAESQRNMQRFRSGESPLIVSSTAIEVGVNVPDIGLMVINRADCFGLSQLHQLRGRLARQGGSGHFLMLEPAKVSKDTSLRLQALVEHDDGFSLAERDMEIRGFGDVLGERQNGGVESIFKLARLSVSDFMRPQESVAA